MIQVLVADDEAMVRAGVRAILATDDGVEVVAKAVDGYQSVELVRAHRPQVALLDIRMPGLDGLAAAHEIAAVAPTTGVIMPSGRRGLLRHRATVVGRLPSRALESCAQVRAGQVRAGQVSVGQVREVQNRAGQVSPGQADIRHRRAC